MVLIGFFLVINDIEHFFLGLFAIQVFSLIKCLFRSFDPFKKAWCLSYYVIAGEVFFVVAYLYFSILATSLLVGYIFCKYFLPVCSLPFHFPNSAF